MKEEKILQYKMFQKDLINTLNDKGMDEVEVWLRVTVEEELYARNDKIEQFRNTDLAKITISAIKNKQSSTVKRDIDFNNKNVKSEIINELTNLVESSPADEANCFANHAESRAFHTGPQEAEPEQMYEVLNNYLNYVHKTYPKINIKEGGITYNKELGFYMNSHGADLSASVGNYSFGIGFVGKDGEKTSSMNYFYQYLNDLDQDLTKTDWINNELKLSIEHINATKINDKFEGEVILTPNSVDGFTESLFSHLTTDTLISKTSKLEGKVGEQIVSELLTIGSYGVHPELAKANHISRDGFLTENVNLIENGVLQSYLLGLYGSKKTGLPRSGNTGESIVINAGDTPYDDMIKSTKKGILLGYFAGGRPNDNGDFSGVAKNSFLIEDGKITKAVMEVMITGNIFDMFNNISQISRETINTGYAINPWIKIEKMGISG